MKRAHAGPWQPADFSMIGRGRDAPVYLGFIVPYLAIIATGIAFVRQAQTEAHPTAGAAPAREPS
jgi:hypothetical protein